MKNRNIIMKNRNRMVSGIILLLLALTFTISTVSAQENQTVIVDDIKPYAGSIGPGSALYGLKIAFENLGESFTFDEKVKIEIELEHAKDRIAEVKAELEKNNSNAADIALVRYREKIEAVNATIPRVAVNASDLVPIQSDVVKQQFVLENLIESHRNRGLPTQGLERALENSQRLEVRFENKTEIRIEREPGKDRIRIRIQGRGEGITLREETKINAEIVGNDTEVKVETEFVIPATDKTAIAQEILTRLQLSREAIDGLLKVQTGEREDLIERLRAEAKVVAKTGDNSGRDGGDKSGGSSGSGRNGGDDNVVRTSGLYDQIKLKEAESGDNKGGSSSGDNRGGEAQGGDNRPVGENKGVVGAGMMATEVKAEFRFPLLNTTNRTDIVDKTFQKLSGLTQDMIFAALDFRAENANVQEEEKVRAEIVGNDTQVKVEFKFTSNNTNKTALAQEILNRLNSINNNVENLLEVQLATEEQLKRELKAKAEVENGVAQVEAEFSFFLPDTTDRTAITAAIHRELSNQTVMNMSNIFTALQLTVKDEQQQQDVNREQEAERGGAGEAERGGGSSSSGGGSSSGSGSSGGGGGGGSGGGK